MAGDSVVALPRPGDSITDDLLLVMLQGARRLLTQAVEAEVRRSSPPAQPVAASA